MWSTIEAFVENIDIKWVIFSLTAVNIVSFVLILGFLFTMYSQPELFIDLATKARMLAQLDEEKGKEGEGEGEKKEKEKSDAEKSQSSESDYGSESDKENKGKGKGKKPAKRVVKKSTKAQ